MSNLESSPQETACGGRAAVAVEPTREVLAGRPVALGGPRGMRVTRTLPDRDRRMVGAWCFVDHYGPDDVSSAPGMQVAAAPAHRAADGQLAGRRRGAAPRQPRQRAAGPARPAQPDDRRARHRPLRGVAARPLAGRCTASSCGWRCRTGTAASRPPSSTTRTCPCSTDTGVDRHGDHGRARRRHLAGRGLQPAGRRRGRAATRRGRRAAAASRPSSTPRWPSPAGRRRRRGC